MSAENPKSPPQCPACGKKAVAAFKPFCSAGCKDRDLLKWLDEGYRIPGPMALEDEEDMPQGSGGDDA